MKKNIFKTAAALYAALAMILTIAGCTNTLHNAEPTVTADSITILEDISIVAFKLVNDSVEGEDDLYKIVGAEQFKDVPNDGKIILSLKFNSWTDINGGTNGSTKWVTYDGSDYEWNDMEWGSDTAAATIEGNELKKVKEHGLFLYTTHTDFTFSVMAQVAKPTVPSEAIKAEEVYSDDEFNSSADTNGSTNYRVSSLVAKADSEKLYVTVWSGSRGAVIYKNDILNVLINVVDSTDGASDCTEWYKPSTTTSFSNGKLNFIAYVNTENYSNVATDASFGEPSSYLYTNAKNSITFTIPLSDIGTITVGTKLKIVATFSSKWNDGTVVIKDGVPKTALSLSGTNSATCTIDFSKGLELTFVAAE